MKIEWEDVDEYHVRAKVPGGWLVKVLDWGDGRWVVTTEFFYPDPSHLWRDEVAGGSGRWVPVLFWVLWLLVGLILVGLPLAYEHFWR